MNAQARLGAVVLVYGRHDRHEDLIRALVDAGVEADAIAIIHNPLHPGDPPCRSVDPRTVVIQNPSNLGYGHGMNVGIAHQLARPVEFVLILTQETRLRPGTLDQLLGAAQANCRLGVLGPSLVFDGERPVRTFGGWIGRGQTGHHTKRADSSGADAIHCDWVDGAAMLIRADVLRAIGGFDEQFFMYFEDVDLCYRAAEAGWEVGVVSNAEASQTSGGADRPEAYGYLMSRNGLAFFRRTRGRRGVAERLAATIGESLSLIRTATGRSADAAQRFSSLKRLRGVWRGVAAFLRHLSGPPPSLGSRHVDT